MICPVCHKPNRVGSVFCEYCGAHLNEINPTTSIPWTLKTVRIYAFIFGYASCLALLVSLVTLIVSLEKVNSFNSTLLGGAIFVGAQELGIASPGELSGLTFLIFFLLLAIWGLPAWGFLMTGGGISKKKPSAQTFGITFFLINMLLFIIMYFQAPSSFLTFLTLLMIAPFVFLVMPVSARTFEYWKQKR